MKAATHTTYGSPQVLQITELERPTPGERDVLVHVHASPVTQGDRRLRAADYPGLGKLLGRLFSGLFRPRNPIPGTNFAGRIVAVGDAVTRFAVGDDVFGSCHHGALAEYLVVPEDGALAPMPANLPYAEAAAVPYGAVVALGFVRDIAKVQPGERVLIVGASGGVGRFAVQLSKHFGAEVTGVCSRRNFDMVRDLGADDVIDYATEDFTKNGQTYDVIFDTVSGTRFARSRGSLTPTGRYATLFVALLAMMQMLVTSVFGGRKVFASVVFGDQRVMGEVSELLAAGAIWPVIAERYPLGRVVDAHAGLEAKPAGAVVVTVSANERAAA
jgi:NADPH:quinone reductase-like Zn-dependent oxidoreductase